MRSLLIARSRKPRLRPGFFMGPNLSAVCGVPCRLVMLTYTKRTLRFPAVPRLAYDRNLLVPRSLLIARSRTRKIGPGPVPGLFFGRRFATARDAHVHETYTALALPRLITALNRNPLMRSLIAHSKIERTPASAGVFYGTESFGRRRRSVPAGNAHVHKTYAPLSSRPAPCLRPKSSSPSLITHSRIEND